MITTLSSSFFGKMSKTLIEICQRFIGELANLTQTFVWKNKCRGVRGETLKKHLGKQIELQPMKR